MRDYIGIANQYIEDVLNGVMPACKYVIQACERQKDELTKKGFKYSFSEDRASHVCRFIELLPHVKGEWRGQPLTLEPPQIFILTTVFGWVDNEGRRRFKTAYIEVPRKNAKSTISSGVALYCLLADGEGGAEVYSAATTRDQARIVFADAVNMVNQCAGIRKRFGVEVMGKNAPHTIFNASTASNFKPLSRDQGGNLDGLNVHCGVIDELHAHKTRDVFDVIETATGSRRQPLLWLITTAGFNRSGICYEQRAYVIKLLSGVHNDDEYFGIIYTIDDDDDWTLPASWQKANPNWGVSVKPEDIERKARKAMQLPSATNNFLTKHLNVWVNADTAWMDMRRWDAQGDPSLKIEDFAGESCWLGLDLASKIDIAAEALLFKKKVDDQDHYYLFCRYWLPEETVENSENSQYQGWVRQGVIEETDGSIIDYDVIEEQIKKDCADYNATECCYDPFQATQLSTRLSKEGLTMIEVRPTVLNFSEPMKEFEALVLDGRLHHNGDPALTWMVSNVVCHRDAKDNIYPRKEFEQNKIDGVVAALMALNRAMFAEESTHYSIYNTASF